MPSAVILGTPQIVHIVAGPADPAHSMVRVASPGRPAVGSGLVFEISLADAYSNTITGGSYSNPALASLYNNTVKLVMSGAYCIATAVAACL